ncbi:MAG TPA: M23 family metallopeptidase [Marmoricola sp.]|nr:M23 family metallopeptidase [Marmoricola sp.]
MGNHRSADRGRRRSATGTSSVTPQTAGATSGSRPGRRRAARPARASLISRIPAVPSIAGVAVLAVAAVGAVHMEQQTPDATSVALRSPSPMHHYGTDAIGFSSDREMAISRDSERQALADAAQARLLAAAEQQAAERNAELKSLGRAAEARATAIAENRWKLPLPEGVYRISAGFGMAGSLWSSDHTGLDMSAPSGTPITAVANGVITETGYDGSYGNKTVQRLEDGTEIWYCHQTSFNVSPGDTVTGGQQIGSVGSTGNSTGPHLHVEVRPGGGDPVDPMQAFIFHGLNP